MRCICSILILLRCITSNAGPLQDSAILSASTRYSTNLAIRHAFIGNNYRATWALPVRMPVFNISKEQGGLKIVRLGGGAQSKSLRLVDKDSVEWVLRTVDKNVKGVLPVILRRTFVTRIVQDMISTAYPYAPLVVAELAKALYVNAPYPRLFYVPDDTALQKYKPYFSQQVCMLERASPTTDGSDAVSTIKMFDDLSESNRYSVNDTAFLKGRLLDILIADWDRHEDQYKWGVSQKESATIYYPIFRDRDQAFFYSDGLLLLKTRLFALKNLRNFSPSVRKFRQLAKRSRNLDKALLNKFEEQDWQNIIGQFQQTLSDSVLGAAVKKLPREAFEKDGVMIFEILKARRNGLMKYGMRYYKFLSKNVIISGTKSAEIFEAKNEKGQLTVTVHDKKSKSISYHRKFAADNTAEITLLSFDENDEVLIDHSFSESIKITRKKQPEKINESRSGKYRTAIQ